MPNALMTSRSSRPWLFEEIHKIAAMIDMQNYSEIPTLAKSSLLIREQIGEEQGYMMTLEIWGRALISLGDYKQAEIKQNEAQKMATPNCSPLFHTIIDVTLARLYFAWNKADIAREHAIRAREIAIRRGLWHQLRSADNLLKKYIVYN